MTFANQCILAFCRLGIAGLAPKAPGTWGTAEACVLAPFIFMPLDYIWRILFLIVLFITGGLAATRAEEILHETDPGQVVIDELVGVWLVLLPFKKTGAINEFWLIVVAFIFFRIFDIAKPWPIKASETWLPGGFGVMIDDVLAGVYALICVFILHWLKII